MRGGDEDARKSLILAYLRLVVSIARGTGIAAWNSST